MKRETLVGMIDEIETRITKHLNKVSLLQDEKAQLIVSLKKKDKAACRETVAGTVPSWAGEDQVDPCSCVLLWGHEGKHQCSHTKEKS